MTHTKFYGRHGGRPLHNYKECHEVMDWIADDVPLLCQQCRWS